MASYGSLPLQEIQPGNSRMSSCSDEDQAKVAVLMKKARGAVEEGHPRAALEMLQKAAKIQRTEKIMKRIAKLEAYLAENGSEDEEEDDDNMVHVGKGFYVYKELYNRLYEYQRESLLWFWRLHRKRKGGILGDDMGLGKTVQVVAFLSGLFDLEQVSSVLIVVPVALVINWQKEFSNWAPGIGVYVFHGATKRERERLLKKVQRRGGVLMVSYGLVMTCWEQLIHHHGAEFVWDYVILDEGHKIKNPTKTTKAVNAITAYHRFILTGTPIQNNLKELWSLFNFVTQGTLLGTLQTFKSEYDNPITRAREKDATASEKILGNEMAESLRLLIAPYFLRRTKADVLEKKKDPAAAEETGSEKDETDSVASGSTRDGRSLSPKVSFPTLTRKNDLIVWLSLTETQIQIYKDFISLDRVKELLMTKRSPLAELTILKKLCDHPRLLSNRACRQLGLQMSEEGYDENDDPSEMESAANSIHNISEEALFLESGKLQFLVTLLGNLRQEGHRCLVFSQSRKMLDIVEKVLKARHFKLMRLDGTVTKLSDREDRINRFQGNDSYSVFLLTTQVGGVGLTLTGADRVVIIDPSWNPATDNQAVDRVYRIGQKRTVVIYRLITCGTVEEKIYRRQIFKQSLTNQTTGNSKNPYRYFTGQQLKELFVLDDPKTSQTQMQLENMHSAHRKTDTELDAHIAFLYSTDIFGISDHDLMFSQEAQAEQHHDEEEGTQYVQQRVQRAQELVAQESDLTRRYNDNPKLKKRYSINVNRERLQSGFAEQTGEGVINPPLQDIPKYYRPDQRPDQRPPPRHPSIPAPMDDQLNRTMEDLTNLTLDDTSGSMEESSPAIDDISDDDGPGDCSRHDQEDEEELVILDDSPVRERPQSRANFGEGADGDGSRPPSVFVIEDDSRPGSRAEDRAFIEEGSGIVDGTREETDEIDFDLEADANLEEEERRHEGSGSNGAGSGGSGVSEESFELMVGRSPPKRQENSFREFSSAREDASSNVFDRAASHISVDTGSSCMASDLALVGDDRSAKHAMPSFTDSYGMMETTNGQPSDLPYFNATRKLSVDTSRAASASLAESRVEENRSAVQTIEWEAGVNAHDQMDHSESPNQVGGRGEDVEDENSNYGNSEDEEGSFGEVVEVASFCCQAEGGTSQEMDDESITEDAPCDEGNRRALNHSEVQSSSAHKVRNSREEDSYIDVSMASFCGQAEEHDISMDTCQDQRPLKDSLQDTKPLPFQDSHSAQSGAEHRFPKPVSHSPIRRHESRESETDRGSRSSASNLDEGQARKIDLDATSRLLGLTGTDSPFMDTSSPVLARGRHIRRLASDDDVEKEEKDGSFGGRTKKRRSQDGGRPSWRVASDEEAEDTGQKRSGRRKQTNVLVGDSEDEMEDEEPTSSSHWKSSSSEQQNSMADFIVGDSDEEADLSVQSAGQEAVIDDSMEADKEENMFLRNQDRKVNREHRIENNKELEEDRVEELPRRKPKKSVIDDDDDEDDFDHDDKDIGREQRRSVKKDVIDDDDTDYENSDDNDDDEDESIEEAPQRRNNKRRGVIDDDSETDNDEADRSDVVDGASGCQDDEAGLSKDRNMSSDTPERREEEGRTDEEEEEEEEEEDINESEVDEEEEDGNESEVDEEHNDSNEEHNDSNEHEGDDEDVSYYDDDEEEEGDYEDDDEEEEELDEEMKLQYKQLVTKGMTKLNEGNNKGALRAFLQALNIDGSSEKLQMIALKLKQKVLQESSL